MDFDDAITTHLQWISRLENALRGLDRDRLDPHAVRDPHACDFGRWLAAAGGLFADPERHGSLDALHRRFHEEAGEVASLVASGDRRRASLADRTPFHDASRQLVDALFEARGAVPQGSDD